MKVEWHKWGWAAGLMFSACGARAVDGAEPCRVRVIEGRIGVYSSTNAVREALAWLPSGTEFSVCGELGDDAWVSIEPPDTVSVWIYRELVRDGVVVADKSLVRTGAGLSFRPVAVLDKGAAVAVRGVYGDWLKIKPPADVRFWVLRDQVEPVATQPSPEADAALSEPLASMLHVLTNETTIAAFTNVVNEPAPERPPARARPAVPPELSGFVLEETPGQGEKVILKGTLDWGGVGAVSAPFCLIAQQADGDSLPVCHLLAPELTYGPHIGAAVTIEGTRWRVKGTPLPFVIPHAVRLGN